MFKAVILDLDGTVYRGNTVIKGVPEAIVKLRKAGFKIFFLSNSSTNSRKQQSKKLKSMSIPCAVREMYNSAYATASYIKHHYPRAKVYVISEGGLQDELTLIGLKVLDSENANIVATGLDRKLTFDKLSIALRAIRNGALFIASNADRIYPTEKGILPGSGTIAAFLEYGSGKKPIVIGKPETHLVEAVLEDNKLKRNEVLIVGDNLESDLKVAKKMKMKCALVLSGLTKQKDIKKLKKKDRPDFVLKTVVDLPEIL